MENKEIVLKKALTLKARLGPLSEYIENGGGKSFAQFLIDKGIPKETFLADLPDKFKVLPAYDFGQVVGYTEAMSKLYSELMKDLGENRLSYSMRAMSDGISGGDSLPDGKFYNGDGLGIIRSDEDPDNWVEAVTYDGSSEFTLRWALGRAWEMMVEWARQADVKAAENDSEALVYLGMKMDDTAMLIDWLEKRLDGRINAQVARQAFEERHHYRVQEWDAYVKSRKVPSTGPFNKLKDTLNEIGRIAKQDWKSVVSGLKKSPKEILDDLKKEIQKDLGDVKVFIKNEVNIHNANKYNPIFVLGRKGFKTLLELNIFGLAWNFNRIRTDADQTYWTRVTKRWELLGGDIGSLTQSIDKGKGRTPIVYKLKNLRINFNADGNNKAALITGTLGTLAAATPTIVNSISENTIGPETTAAIQAAGGVVAAMAPIMVAFGKKKGENVSGSETEPPIGEGQMPPAPTEPTSEPIPTGVKIAIGAGLGLALIIGVSLVVFGGSKGK